MNTTLALNGGPKAVTRTAELAAAARWPVYTEEEQAAVVDAMRSDNVYAPTAPFEQEFAEYHRVRYALTHCNGSAALHAAYFAVGVQPGDEVITSPYTWHLQTGQILALHALPVFCDIDPRSACIDPNEIRRKITPRTRAIVVVHPFGAVSPMDEIMEIAREHNIPVVEDCSHAHGATYKGRRVGTIGDIGCFSLQASKLMNAIEGGILITNNERYYARACALAHYDYLPRLAAEEYRRFNDPTREQAPACFGFKYRIHPLASAVARVQLRLLDERNAVRRRNMGYLTQRIAEVGRDILLPPYESQDMVRTWLNYICVYYPERTGVSRDTFLKALQAEGVPATGGRQGYLPIYWNPLYEERVGIWGEGDPFEAPQVKEKITYERGMCPVAETFWRRCIGLPMLHWEADRALLDEIVFAIEKVICNLDALREGERA